MADPILRCDHPFHVGDPTVFGSCVECHPEPEVERPYETTLGPDELEDR